MPPEIQEKIENNSPAVEPDAVPKAPEEERPAFMHTYETDLARSMDSTDAAAVQSLLADARERESDIKEFSHDKHARGWYLFGSALLLLVALAAAGYGYIHYRSLTVPLTQSVRLGVFPSTRAVIAGTTDIRKLMPTLLAETTFDKDRPSLIPIVTDDRTLAPLSEDELYAFMESAPPASLRHAITGTRLGLMNTGIATKPFIVMSVPDAEIASKELLLAEPTLLETFYKPLGIDLALYTTVVGSGFASEYAYNLPVRVLRYANTDAGTNDVLLMYGYVAPNVMAITTDPVVLRGVYDTIIRQ